MRRITITALILMGLALPVVAQEAGAPGNGGAPAAEGAPPLLELDRTHALAAKLAGLVGFANTSCPDVQGNPDLLKAAVQRMGIDPKELDQGQIAFVARSYLEGYRKDIPENCKRALETFGASSALVPNLIVKR